MTYYIEWEPLKGWAQFLTQAKQDFFIFYFLFFILIEGHRQTTAKTRLTNWQKKVNERFVTSFSIKLCLYFCISTGFVWFKYFSLWLKQDEFHYLI